VPTFEPRQDFAKVGWPYATWYVDQMVESASYGINWDATYEVLYGVFPGDEKKYTMGIFRPGYKYYISLEQARIIIPLNLGIVRYTDDYNDEYSDYFVCNTKTNTPDYPATVPQPIE
jgi:hypothetical protein